MWNWRKIITIKMYTESFSIVHYHPNGAFKNHAPPSLASDHRVISLTQFWETRVVFVRISFYQSPSSGCYIRNEIVPKQSLSKRALCVAFEISAWHDLNIESVEMFSSLSWERFLSSGQDVFPTIIPGTNKNWNYFAIEKCWKSISNSWISLVITALSH